FAGTQSKSTSVTRGDGKIGASTTKTSSSGKVDDEGNLVKGRELTTNKSGGVIAGPEGVGGFGNVGATGTTTHAKGVKTGVSVGASGRFVVAINEVSTDPLAYDVVVTVAVGAKLGLSGSAEKEGEEKSTVSGSLSGE